MLPLQNKVSSKYVTVIHYFQYDVTYSNEVIFTPPQAGHAVIDSL